MPQYGNRPQEGAAEANTTASCKARIFAEEMPSFANITASCKAARMFQTKHYDPLQGFEKKKYTTAPCEVLRKRKL